MSECTDVEAGVANKFVKLGNIRGVPIAQIVNRVGPPTSISSTVNGQLYQWIKTSAFFGSYHYAITVNAEGNAVGYTHQFSR
jgi:hypothetical protein